MSSPLGFVNDSYLHKADTHSHSRHLQWVEIDLDCRLPKGHYCKKQFALNVARTHASFPANTKVVGMGNGVV